MSTDGIVGLYIGTANYGATAAFWGSLGYTADFETGHGSGQWRHPTGGPYVFIDENVETPTVYPILGVADASAFAPARTPQFAKEFTPEHWGVMEAHLLDPDARIVSLQAPLPAGTPAPSADDHHGAKYA